MPNYKKRDIDSRLKDLGAEPLHKQGWDFETTYKRFKIPGIIVTHPDNEVPDIAVNKLARKIADIGKYDISLVKNVLKGRTTVKKLGGVEKLVTPAIIIFSIGLVVFTLARANITGAVIGISNTTSNIGMVVCVLGIIGLLIYKKRCK